MSVLYTATCPECGSVVAGIHDAVPAHDLATDLGRWVQDGLRIERHEGDGVVARIAPHREGCALSGSRRHAR